ncbi:hypothetical protein H8A95_05185 [Bradyrhizobium sp. Pear76]|uniref:hypothetical protein n=1 Tax=Bradyrhizobium oropedii TaxID=1571201 RepID=UPI001E3A4FB7|nr:hypothetical protein [Bradyrhizobium oropedii]MCC8961729.1 hypothetical protein [Bradyrhizobium oropedii]
MRLLEMENPALASGAPEVSLAASKIDPDNATSRLRLQFLAQVFDLPASTAAVVADLAFGEALR